jgi:hypothetical protein
VSSNAALLLSQVAVWGGNLRETNLTAGLTNIIGISGGAEGQFGYDCLALRNNGTIVTWPANLLGTQTNGVTNIIAIAGAGYGLRADRTAVALSYYGASPVPGFTNLAAISVYNGSLLGLRTNGSVFGGNPAGIANNAPPGLSNVVAIAQGGSFALALRADGTVLAWGSNIYGQTNVPGSLSNVVAIAAGYYNPVALKSDGTVVVWGLNTAGVTNPPVTATNVVAIAAGFEHIVALRGDGSVVAWGYNNLGQTNVPSGLSNVVAIAAGGYFSMAMLGSGPPSTQAYLTQPVMGVGSFNLTVPTQSGRVYSLEYKDNLADPNWVLLPLVPGNGNSLPLTDPAATNSQRFYRVQRW